MSLRGPIGTYYSPDMPDEPAGELSVIDGQLLCRDKSGERLPYRSTAAD